MTSVATMTSETVAQLCNALLALDFPNYAIDFADVNLNAQRATGLVKPVAVGYNRVELDRVASLLSVTYGGGRIASDSNKENLSDRRTHVSTMSLFSQADYAAFHEILYFLFWNLDAIEYPLHKFKDCWPIIGSGATGSNTEAKRFAAQFRRCAVAAYKKLQAEDASCRLQPLGPVFLHSPGGPSNAMATLKFVKFLSSFAFFVISARQEHLVHKYRNNRCAESDARQVECEELIVKNNRFMKDFKRRQEAALQAMQRDVEGMHMSISSKLDKLGMRRVKSTLFKALSGEDTAGRVQVCHQQIRHLKKADSTAGLIDRCEDKRRKLDDLCNHVGDVCDKMNRMLYTGGNRHREIDAERLRTSLLRTDLKIVHSSLPSASIDSAIVLVTRRTFHGQVLTWRAEHVSRLKTIISAIRKRRDMHRSLLMKFGAVDAAAADTEHPAASGFEPILGQADAATVPPVTLLPCASVYRASEPSLDGCLNDSAATLLDVDEVVACVMSTDKTDVSRRVGEEQCHFHGPLVVTNVDLLAVSGNSTPLMWLRREPRHNTTAAMIQKTRLLDTNVAFASSMTAVDSDVCTDEDSCGTLTTSVVTSFSPIMSSSRIISHPKESNLALEHRQLATSVPLVDMGSADGESVQLPVRSDIEPSLCALLSSTNDATVTTAQPLAFSPRSTRDAEQASSDRTDRHAVADRFQLDWGYVLNSSTASPTPHHPASVGNSTRNATETLNTSGLDRPLTDGVGERLMSLMESLLSDSRGKRCTASSLLTTADNDESSGLADINDVSPSAHSRIS